MGVSQLLRREEIRVGGGGGAAVGDVGAGGVQPRRVVSLQIGDQLVAVNGVVVAAVGQLISEGEHDKGGVVCKFLDDCEGLFCIIRSAHVVAQHGIVPAGQLGLQIESQLIRGGKCGVRGAPAVEAYRVDAVGLVGAKQLLPLGRVHGGRIRSGGIRRSWPLPLKTPCCR